MEVKLITRKRVHMATGQILPAVTYDVIFDGVCVGHVGMKPGSRLFFIVRLPDEQRQQVEAYVAESLGRAVESKAIPDVPPELLEPDEGEMLGEIIDDID